MLFILIMEPLQRMFKLASDSGILTSLARVGLGHRMSIFADEFIVFIKPVDIELRTSARIMEMYSTTSGLRVNLQKTSTIPICYSEVEMTRIEGILGCRLGSFLSKHLGLPLCLKKPSVAQLHGLVDQLANRLPT